MKLSFFRPRVFGPHNEKLCGLSLFAGLDSRELDIVSTFLHERDYLAEEVLFDEGEEGHAIYIVLSGSVTIRRNVATGHPTLVATIGPMSFFGELALLTNAPRATQARAVSNAKLLVFFRDDFNHLLTTHVEIAAKIGINLARHVGARLREAVVGGRVEQSL